MEVVEAVERRRARRVMDVRPIDEGSVVELLEAGRLSASCFNNQPWRFILCTGESLGSVKVALPRGNAWATRAPLVIVVAARSADDCELGDRREYYLFDCGLAVGQMLLRATELGFIAHPIAGYDPVKVRAALGIPDDHVVITLIVCGYPGTDDSLLSDKQKISETERPERKRLGEFAFVGRWGAPFN
ncbi:MAG: nitroreductase family protein [Thermoplasmata archaeon]|nr:nitroreductase family protein [Thermoplasmata archaeon]